MDVLNYISAKRAKRLQGKRWKIVSWSFPEWGENLYFPQHFSRKWYWPFRGYRDIPNEDIGYVAFKTNEEAVTFCKALNPTRVVGSRARKENWEPLRNQQCSEDDGSLIVVGAILGCVAF